MISSAKLDVIKTIIDIARGLETHEIEALRSALHDLTWNREQNAKKEIKDMLNAIAQ